MQREIRMSRRELVAAAGVAGLAAVATGDGLPAAEAAPGDQPRPAGAGSRGQVLGVGCWVGVFGCSGVRARFQSGVLSGTRTIC